MREYVQRRRLAKIFHFKTELGSGPDPFFVLGFENKAGLLMTETIQLGEIFIAVTRKPIKNVHLSVHPPNGRVTLSAPKATRLEVARAYGEVSR
jgi:hypothetical protein